MGIRLIFSFDSEDYETPASDDAEKWWAEAMTRHGFTACVCVVGELARTLDSRGRRDVVQAMSRHEISFHSNMHSAHPTWAEYLDECSWDEGIQRALREESRGITAVRELFDQQPAAWCKPGSSWGPQIAEAMRRLNVPVFCDSPFEWAPGEPLWFSNALFLDYHTSFDRYFAVDPAIRLEIMKRDFLELCARHDGRYLVMYTHPCRLVTASFPKNFTAGANPPRARWCPAPLRPEVEIAQLQRDFDAFLEFVAARPEVDPTTYRQLYRDFAQGAVAWIGSGRIERLLRSRTDCVLDCVRLDTGLILSPAEQFGVLVKAGAEFAETGRLPESVAVQRLLGPTEAIAETVSGEAAVENLLDACRGVDAECRRTGAVPTGVRLGTGEIGPHAFLCGVRGILAEVLTSGRPPAAIPVVPVMELPVFAERDEIRDLRFHGGWSIFPPEFEGRNVIETIRRQTWTAKPAVRRR